MQKQKAWGKFPSSWRDSKALLIINLLRPFHCHSGGVGVGVGVRGVRTSWLQLSELSVMKRGWFKLAFDIRRLDRLPSSSLYRSPFQSGCVLLPLVSPSLSHASAQMLVFKMSLDLKILISGHSFQSFFFFYTSWFFRNDLKRQMLECKKINNHKSLLRKLILMLINHSNFPNSLFSFLFG